LLAGVDVLRGQRAEGRGASWQGEERPEGKMGGARKVCRRAGGTPRAAAGQLARRKTDGVQNGDEGRCPCFSRGRKKKG